MAANRTLDGPAPPRRLGRGLVEIVTHISNIKCRTLGDVGRAWNVLGWGQSRRIHPDKPSKEDFETSVDNMWKFLSEYDGPHEGLRVDIRRCKTKLLDALKTLGFYSRSWRIDQHDLGLRKSNSLHAGRDGVSSPRDDAQVLWNRILPPSKGNPPSQNSSLLRKLMQTAPAFTSELDGRMAADENTRIWIRYCAFYSPGFVSKGADGKLHLFRALPVPTANGNSLWHSIAFFMDGQHGITWHAFIKAEVWAWFTQVLENPAHPRWREYHRLNLLSKFDRKSPDEHPRQIKVKPVFGECSLLRQLHCNDRLHRIDAPRNGNPVYTHASELMLHVVADFYACQIVVFCVTEERKATAAAKAAAKADEPGRGLVEHEAWYFGSKTAADKQVQLFLWTCDFKTFAPCEYRDHDWESRSDEADPTEAESDGLRDDSGNWWFRASAPRWVAKHMYKIDSEPGSFPAPWWAKDHVDPAGPPPRRPHPHPPCSYPQFAHPFSQHVDKNLPPLWKPSPEASMNKNAVRCFYTGTDIPGGIMLDAPTDKQIAGWSSWKGKDPVGSSAGPRHDTKQIRFGGSDHKGEAAKMFDDAYSEWPLEYSLDDVLY